MDRKSSQTDEIQRLIAQGHRARGLLAREVLGFKQRFDLPARLRGSLKRHPTSWLLGALGGGLLASLLLFRRKRVVIGKKNRGFLITILGLALTALRPFAKVWLADRIKNHLAAQLRGHSVRKPIPAASEFSSLL